MTVAISAFYKFVVIDNPSVLRGSLLAMLQAHDMKGTILVAPEGINGTISGASSAMAAVLVMLRSDPRFTDLETKDATSPAHPFRRLKIKLKREIISFGQPGSDPAMAEAAGCAGIAVAPEDWNALIRDPDVVVLDTRNTYEVAVGTFPGAIDPQTRRFGDLPDFVAANLDTAHHRKVAMFCTGGIRCEKAAAFMKSIGFAEVYQLQGGILNYLARVRPEDSLWQGACFVFDERVAVDGDAVPFVET